MTEPSGFKETQGDGYPVRKPGETDSEYSLREAIFQRERRLRLRLEWEKARQLERQKSNG